MGSEAACSEQRTRAPAAARPGPRGAKPPARPSSRSTLTAARRVSGSKSHAVPRDHHEAGEAGDALRVPPVQQIEEGLGADDRCRSPAGPPAPVEGVHRVGGPAPRELDVGDLEARVLAHRERGHPVAVGRGGQLGRRLVGRLGRRHEQEPVEPEGLADLVGHEQVAEVDRVERSAEHADARLETATPGYARRPTPRTWSWSAPARRPGRARARGRWRCPSRRPSRTGCRRRAASRR